jgi:lipopolysaccharide export system permease protein
MTLPMAMLVSVLYAFSRLASENEITAMKASGVSMRSVLAPVLLGGLAMSLVMLLFNDQVLPRANHRLAVLQLDIFRTKPTFALREQVINEIKSGQLYLRATDIDEGTSRMQDVVIYDLTDVSRRRTIYADSGRLALAPNGKDIELVLFHGEMQEIPNKKPTEMNRMFYEKTTKRVRNVIASYQQSETGNVSKGDREMSVCEMQKELSRAAYYARVAQHDMAMTEHELRKGPKPAPPKQAEAPGLGRAYCAFLGLFTVKEARAQAPAPPPQAVPPSAGAGGVVVTESPAEKDAQYVQRMQEARFRLDDARRESNRYGVEIQKKFSLAASCIIFVLIGAPIALRFPRGGVGLVIGVSFAVFGIYYVGLIGGESLANKGYLPPWLAMWAVNILLLVVGLALAARMGRETSTARGGDFGELLATARGKTLGWLRRFGVAVERRRA